MEWKLFSELSPTEKHLEQVKILFTNPSWATAIHGMYQHNESESLKQRLSYYNFEKDAFIEWDFQEPTHYITIPEKPKYEGN